MKNTSFFAVLGLFSLSAFAADPTVTCTLAKTTRPTRQIVMTAPMSKMLENGAYTDDSLSMGRYGYSFSASASKTAKGYDFNIIFSEDIAEDQVGELNCSYESTMGAEAFCVEPISGHGIRKPLQFSCNLQ